jgi:prepilin-type processing-associated H-X9-DG protein
MYNAYNFNRGADEPTNYTVGFTQVAVFLCPSDSFQGQRPSDPWAANNYHGNHGGPGLIRNWSGTIVQNFTTYPQAWWGQDSNLGYFGFTRIRDGSTNTALFSEKLLGIPGNPVVYPGQPDDKRGIFPVSFPAPAPATPYPATPATVATTMAALGTCKSVPAATGSSGSYLSGAHWSLSYPWHTSNSAYTHFNTPNGLSCWSTQDPVGNPWGGLTNLITATSDHPGGVNVCMTDGSVKFIKDTIAPTIWWAIGTRNGNEVVSSDSYQ